MRTKNLTPFPFGAKLTSRRPPELEMTLVVRGAFRLAPREPVVPLDEIPGLSQGPMTAEVYRDDDADRSGECLYGGDFADFKLNAEVTLRGSCHAPGGEAITECPVRFGVGAWSKILRVVGPRAWSDGYRGAVLSEPLPFTRMPIDYAHTFGGPGHAPNPSGKGAGTPEAPNVELAGERLRARGDRLTPASFGPLNPAWPQRSGKMGKAYGKTYREKRAPFYAEDFDWTYFQAAPADQQLPGYLRGDEELVLQNLHPAEPVFVTRLPGLVVRVFVNDVNGRFREVRMNLDTLFAAPDEGLLHLTWRGLDRVEQDDLADVKTIFIASEKLGDEPLPEAHYRALLAEYEADPLELAKKTPARAGELMKRLQTEPADPPPDDPLGARLHRAGHMLDPDERGQLQRGLREANAGMKAAGPQAEGAMAKAVNDLPKAPGRSALPHKPGHLPRMPIGDRVREASAKIAEAKARAAEQGGDLRAFEQLEALLNDPRLAQIDPSLRPDAKPPDEPGPGRDCSGQDFTGADLRGRDLRGINLDAAILTRANLTGANLARANLKHAVLLQTDLTDADLSETDLTHANLTEANGPRVNLARATLTRIFARKASLPGAILTGAQGEFLFVHECDLAGAKLGGVRFFKALFRGGVLERADLTEAQLTRCYFLLVKAPGLVLTNALLDHTSFGESDLTDAKIGDARGEGSIWMRTNLTGADFAWAVLPFAHFTEANLTRARLYGANLKGSRFYRAILDQAEFVRANLFGADLSKARLNGTKLTDANLYDAKLLKASGAGADFRGANLKRSTLEWA